MKLIVGDVVWYWTWEGAKLVPNPATLLFLAEDGSKAFLDVTLVTGYGGRDRMWVIHSAEPKEACWTERPRS